MPAARRACPARGRSDRVPGRGSPVSDRGPAPRPGRDA